MKTFVLILSIVGFSSFYCQDDPVELTETLIQDTLIGSIWSVEDTSFKEEYEDMYLMLAKDTLYVFYFNWIEYLKSSTCNYEMEFTGSFFELKLGECDNWGEARYVYEYLVSLDRLNILFSPNQLRLDAAIFKEEDWIPFERSESFKE
ncbi:MAG: hypothetical protein ACPG21_05525 [Crocinitomicaceae bacterium]